MVGVILTGKRHSFGTQDTGSQKNKPVITELSHLTSFLLQSISSPLEEQKATPTHVITGFDSRVCA